MRGTSTCSRYCLCGVLALAAMFASNATGQVRVVNWNIAQLRGDFAAIEDVLAECSNDDTTGYATPVAVWVFQEVDTDNLEDLHDLLGSQYTQGTFTSSNEDTYSGAQAMFYHSAHVIEILSGHDDLYTGAGRYTDRWQLRLVGCDDPPVDFYIYSSHLKASTGSKNQADRLFGIEQILENAQELPVGSRIIYAGDYNIYTSNEPAYQAIVAEGPVQALDPHGTGSWSGEGNAYKHSQSPRDSAGGGLIGGSLDDRFDFQLHTMLLGDGLGMDCMQGTLRSVGNDGEHYDVAINDGDNSYFPGDTSRSNALADDLFDASDHVPVACDYTEPAVLGAGLTATFETVIVGGTIELTLVVSNDVDVLVPEAGASLPWTAVGDALLSGVNESGQVDPGDAPHFIPLAFTATTSGAVTGTLVVDSIDEDVQHAPGSLDVSGTVLRHSNASFSDAHDENFHVEFAAFTADSGIQSIDVLLYNFEYDSLQARFDLEAVEEPEAPLAFIGSPVPGIGSSPVTLPFLVDTDGLEPGPLVQNLDVHVSDEDLEGATSQQLTLVLSIEITGDSCEGDYTGDGVTNVVDLLEVIAHWDDPYDVSDLLAVIADWDCGS